MSVAFFFMLVGAIAAGFALLWLGLRGYRVNRHPVCRWCSFDLDGIYPAGVTCPECGAGLKRPKSVRIGVRRRLWPIALLGLPLILLPTATLGLAFFAAVTGSSLYKHMPLGVLLFQANYASASASREIAAEVQDRMINRTLTKEQYAEAVEAALALQGDPSRTWIAEWGAVIERARADGEVSTAQDDRYGRQAPTITSRARPRVRPGDTIPVHLSAAGARLAPGEMYSAMVWAHAMRLGEWKTSRVTPGTTLSQTVAGALSPINGLLGYITFQDARSRAAAGRFGGIVGGDALTFGVRCPQNATPGVHRLEIEISLGMENQTSGMSMRQFTAPKRTDPRVSWHTVLLDVEVMPEGQDSVTAVEPTPEVTKRLTESLRPFDASVWRSQAPFAAGGSTRSLSNWTMFNASVTVPSGADVPVAFEVFLLQDSKRWRVGTIATDHAVVDSSDQAFNNFTPAGPIRTLHGSLPDLKASEVDILFVPSAAVARRTTTMTKYYNAEILVKGVKINRDDIQMLAPPVGAGGASPDDPAGADKSAKPAEGTP